MAGIGGGAERVLSHVLEQLASLGWMLRVATFDPPSATTSFYPLPENVEWDRLGSTDLSSQAANIAWRVAKLRRYFGATEPERVVAFMSSSIVPCAAALVGRETDFIASEHIVLSYYDQKRLERKLVGWAMHRARAVTVITPRMRSDFAKRWPEPNYQLVPNPIPPPTGQVAELTSTDPSPTIIAAGNLCERKNFDMLIRAFGRLVERYPSWRLDIWGDGVLRPELESLVKSLGLEDRVRLPGATQKLLAEMRQAQIFAMPSHLESFGMVSLEAMSVGLPVIGLRKCLGTNEVVRHGETGLLVEGEDLTASFEAALRRLMESPEERRAFGEAGLGYASSYDPRRIGKLWSRLLLGESLSTSPDPVSLDTTVPDRVPRSV